MNMHNPAHPGEVLREWLPEGMLIEHAVDWEEPKIYGFRCEQAKSRKLNEKNTGF